jgi:hypothetical protein
MAPYLHLLQLIENYYKGNEIKRDRGKGRQEADYWRFGSNDSSWVTFWHARVVFFHNIMNLSL